MMDKTGCQAVMIGRASEGNPWIFREMNHYYKTGELLPRPTLEERCAMIRRHLSLQMAQKGDYIGLREMRKHAAWYTKGLPSSAQFRMKINQAESKSEFLHLIDALEQGRLEE
jgi:tRNA-dihydrouridine synthase B